MHEADAGMIRPHFIGEGNKKQEVHSLVLDVSQSLGSGIAGSPALPP